MKRKTAEKSALRRTTLNFAHAGGQLWGGPYREYRSVPGIEFDKVFRINMALEIRMPAELVVPTKDYGVPLTHLFNFALLEAGRRLLRGETVFVGCGYGHGRTGTLIAALYKLNREVLYLLRRGTFEDWAFYDPVLEARRGYRLEAIETPAQEAFVRGFDMRRLAQRLAFRARPSVVFDKRFWGL